MNVKNGELSQRTETKSCSQQIKFIFTLEKREKSYVVMQGKKYRRPKWHRISQHRLIWGAQKNKRITVNLLNHVKVRCKFGSLYYVCIQDTSGFQQTVENHSHNTPWPSQNPRENTATVLMFHINSNVTNFASTEDDRGYCWNMTYK